MTMTMLPPEQAAAGLAVEVETMSAWRWAGIGPAYHRIGGSTKGAIRYSPGDLQAYIAKLRMGAA